MWTIKNRKRYDRSHLRYPSDLSDEEWQHIAPLIPPAKQGGRKRTADVREVVTGIVYVREERRKRGACIDPHGYDAGKKIKGKKRHLLVDTLGLLLHAVVHPADIQDRDGGIMLLSTLFGMFPFLIWPK